MDWVTLAEKAELRTKDAFAAVEEATGVTVDRTTFAHLRRLSEIGTRRGGLGIPALLALLARVQRAPEGIVFERIDSHPWTLQVLLVRGPDWVVVDAARTLRRTPEQVWSELRPWKRKLTDNRERLEAWAQNPKRCRLPARPLAEASTASATPLAAIIANPHDDAARLVYADWLEEQGSGQAQLIRLQLQLERTKKWKEQEALEAQITPLLEAGWRDFAGVAAKYTNAKRFRRGFVHTVEMTIAAFEKHGVEVFTGQPVARLRVKERKWTARELKRLADAPAMQHVRELSLGQVDVRKPGLPLAPLADGPGFPKLEKVSFDQCGASAKDWQALFERLNAPRLKQVSTHYNRTSAGLYLGLARNKGLGAFETVDEYAYEVLDPEKKAEGMLSDAIAELAAARPTFRKWVSGNNGFITDAVAGHLYEKQSACAVQAFELNNVPNLTDAFALQVAASKKVEALTSFATHNSGIRAKGVAALAEAAPNLQELRIVCYDDGVWSQADWDAAGQALLEVPEGRPLKGITLDGTGKPSADLLAALKQRYGRVER